MMDKILITSQNRHLFVLGLFILFMLLPFVEMFVASLRPITHLFSRPELEVGETMGFLDFMSSILVRYYEFQAYRDMWVTVPQLPRYIFNSVFIATAVTLLSMCFIYSCCLCLRPL